jgi:hypothetical protein
VVSNIDLDSGDAAVAFGDDVGLLFDHQWAAGGEVAWVIGRGGVGRLWRCAWSGQIRRRTGEGG